MEGGTALTRWFPGAVVLWNCLQRQEWGGGRRSQETRRGRSRPPAQVAEGPRLDRSQSPAVSGAPPRRSSPPTSSEGAAAVREPGAARSARGAAQRRLPLRLAAPRRRSAPGPAAAPRGPWTCPGASWWPGPSACGQVRPPLNPSPGLRQPLPDPPRPGVRRPGARRGALPGSELRGFGGRGFPGKRLQSSGSPSSTPEGGAPRRPGPGTLVCLGRVEEARVEKRRGPVASGHPAFLQGPHRASRTATGALGVARAPRLTEAASLRAGSWVRRSGGRRVPGEPGAESRPESLGPGRSEALGRSEPRLWPAVEGRAKGGGAPLDRPGPPENVT